MKLSALKFETKPGHAPPIYGLMYAGLIAISTLRGYFHLVELPWFVTQFAFVAILGLGFVWVFISGNSSRVNLSLNVMLFQMIPSLVILIWSVSLWVYNREPLSMIMRGSSLIMYQILVFAMLIGPGVMFGGQATEFTALGFILANTLILLDVMRRRGVGTTITGMIQFLMSFGGHDNDVSRNLEVQDVTFGIGILLVYYIVDGKKEHWRWFYIGALTFYLITGFKRILFPAIGLAIVYYWLMNKIPRNIQKSMTILIGVLLIIISMGYVILIRTGLWFDLCDRFGIDLMGRKRLYGYMESYYTISFDYMGLGNGIVSTVLEVLEKTGNRRLHSDVLRMYIELGMPVFLLWCFLLFVYTYTHFANKHSQRSATIYMAITLLMYITFLTDNTLEKYCPEIAWHVLPLSVILEDREKFKSSFRYRESLLDERTESWKIMQKTSKTPENKLKALQKPKENTANMTVAQALKQFRTQKSKKED